MKGFGLLIYGLSHVRGFVKGAYVPTILRPLATTPIGLDTTQVQLELGSLVSKTTAIFGPGDSRFQSATSRWSIYGAPKIALVVEPGSEHDVSTVVRA